jgi:hypothetical protein
MENFAGRIAPRRTRRYGLTMDLTDELETLERYLKTQDRLIAQQREIIDLLERAGRDIEDSVDLLRTFQAAQTRHIVRRSQLRAELNR